MKINPAHKPERPAVTKRKRAEATSGKDGFGDALRGATHDPRADLEILFGEIDESGQVLRDSPGLDNFRQYRERVASFIKEFLEQAYDVRQTSEMTLSGRQRHTILVKNIDDRMEQMYQEFLKEIIDMEKMMSGIDEIRGMLLDLYQ